MSPLGCRYVLGCHQYIIQKSNTFRTKTPVFTPGEAEGAGGLGEGGGVEQTFPRFFFLSSKVIIPVKTVNENGLYCAATY